MWNATDRRLQNYGGSIGNLQWDDIRTKHLMLSVYSDQAGLLKPNTSLPRANDVLDLLCDPYNVYDAIIVLPSSSTLPAVLQPVGTRSPSEAYYNVLKRTTFICPNPRPKRSPRGHATVCVIRADNRRCRLCKTSELLRHFRSQTDLNLIMDSTQDTFSCVLFAAWSQCA